MRNDKKVPEIRFEGFEEEWTPKRFSDLYEYASEGGTPDTHNLSYYKEGTIPFVKIEDTSNKYITETKSFITEDGMNHSSAWLIPEGSVFFTNGATIGNVAINKIPVTTKQGILGIIPKSAITNEYLYYLLSSMNFQHEVANRLTTGTFSTIILKNLDEIPVYCTDDIKEQRPISDILSNLDGFITLSQQKWDSLKSIKACLLQKMFPRDGEKVPEIRFEGFNGEWEERTLSSMVTRVTRKNTELQSLLPLTISAQYGLVDQSTYFNNRVASDNLSNYYLVKKGEFAYNKSYSDGYPYGAVKRLDLYDMGVLSTLYIVFAIKDSSVHSDFLVSCFDTTNWHKQISEHAAEGARNHGLLNISAEDFLDITLLIPPTLQEQMLVGISLKILDTLIGNYQGRLDKLKDCKSAILQKMLI